MTLQLQIFTIVGFIVALIGWGFVMKLLIDQMIKWNTWKNGRKILYCSIFLLFLFLALSILLKFDYRFNKLLGGVF